MTSGGFVDVAVSADRTVRGSKAGVARPPAVEGVASSFLISQALKLEISEERPEEDGVVGAAEEGGVVEVGGELR